jgi:hypothetical protein
VTVTVRAGCGPTAISNGQYFISSTETGIVQGSPTVVTNVAGGSTAPVGLTISSVATSGAGANGLEPGAIVQHTITLQNTVAARRPYVRFVVNAGRSAHFDQILDAGGGSAALLSPTTLEWTGALDPSATVTVVVTTRVDDCPNPAHLTTQLHDGLALNATDVCGRTLGSAAAPAAFPLRHPIAVSIVALGLDAPAPSFGPGGRLQVGRADSDIDFQISLSNQVSSPQSAVTVTLPVPADLTPVGSPPFVPPTASGATYDPATRLISWTGSLSPNQTVVITFRARLPNAGLSCQTVLTVTAQGSGCANPRSTIAVAVIPPVPATPYVVGSDNRLGLWMVRPGIDAAAQRLLCFTGEIYDGVGVGPTGDIWVAGLPSYRFNPHTLELDVVTERVDPDAVGRVMTDAAVDTSTNPATVIYVHDGRPGTVIQRYNPATGQASIIRANAPALARVVVDTHGRIIGVTSRPDAPGLRDVIVIDPSDPALDRRLNDPQYGTLDVSAFALDRDGTLLLAVNRLVPPAPDTQDLVRVNLDTGAFTLVATDIDPLVPGFPGSGQFFTAFAAGTGGDLYAARRAGGLGVVHPTLPATGALLATTPIVADIALIDPSPTPPPPPPPSGVAIDVFEAVRIADNAEILPGVTITVTEDVAVVDDVRSDLSLMLNVAETVVVSDAPGVQVATPVNTTRLVGAAAFLNQRLPELLVVDISTRNGVPQGGLMTYLTLRSGLLIVASRIESVAVSNNTATIEGTALVNGRSGHRFTLTVIDGQPDVFGIVVRRADGRIIYDHRQAATEGNLRILR